MPSLVSLPVEIILCISDNIGISNLNSLVQSCVRSYYILNKDLYKLGSLKGLGLHHVAKEGQISGAMKLLSTGSDIDLMILVPLKACSSHRNDNGPVRFIRVSRKYRKGRLHMTPLHCAAMYGQLEMVRFLIDHGANIDKSWGTKASPVYLAAFMPTRISQKCFWMLALPWLLKARALPRFFPALPQEIRVRSHHATQSAHVNAQVRPDSDSHALLRSADMYDDRTRDRLQKIESGLYAKEVASNRSKEAPWRIKPSECVFPDSICDLDKELEMPSLADLGEFSEPDETLLDEMALSPGSTRETQSQDSGRFMQHTVGSDKDLGSDWDTRLPAEIEKLAVKPEI
ncbi:hypothetical protein D8B26_005105 [Coccidioides posadasii str. Silveira]|uniref:Uncharacterized protein n=1 Tax=Coccidioides posadasii (strain RMSCC 757 / Silveira) TaxID=443226 RepID=E9D5U9_COCPS|nr:conserved hypothetical protein [Coccidioides posadasii str. Silveira]QVM10444.1 hypothetical protein D8B26_005105 [Coccidioides posadasii str. Silveira]